MCDGASPVSTRICGLNRELNMQNKGTFTLRRLFPSLSDEALNQLQAQSSVINLRKGKNLFVSGDTPRSVYAVAKGALKVVRESSDGNCVITKITNAGDFMGLREVFGRVGYARAAVALRDSEVFVIDANEIKNLALRDSSVAGQFLEIMARDLALLESRVESNVFQSARNRVSSVLHSLYGSFGEEGSRVFQPPLSRRDIAEMADVAPETVSRVLSDLKTSGILDSRGPVFEVLDLDALSGEHDSH